MIQPQHNTPQVDALRAMQESLTNEQIIMLAEILRQTKGRGWGTVAVVFKDGRADTVTTTISEKLPRE